MVVGVYRARVMRAPAMHAMGKDALSTEEIEDV